jgi:hypothetical protein
VIPHCFVIFRQDRRARVARPPLAHFGGDIWIGDRRFYRWKSFCQFHHMTCKRGRLLGFQLVILDLPPDAAPWWRWVETCENCSYTDNEFTVLLTDQLPQEYYPDCAAIIGGDIYHDGSGEFVIVIPDMNEWKSPDRVWSKMWNSIGFGFTELEVRRDSKNCDT